MDMAYDGPLDAVDVPDLGLFGVVQGEPVEIADQTARGQLRRQGWSYVRQDDMTTDESDTAEPESPEIKDGDAS